MNDERPKTLGVKVTMVNKTVLIATRDAHKWCCSICTVGGLVQREFDRNRLRTMNAAEALREAILAADQSYNGFAAAITGYSEQVETTFDIDLSEVAGAGPPSDDR